MPTPDRLLRRVVRLQRLVKALRLHDPSATHPGTSLDAPIARQPLPMLGELLRCLQRRPIEGDTLAREIETARSPSLLDSVTANAMLQRRGFLEQSSGLLDPAGVFDHVAEVVERRCQVSAEV